MSFAPSGYALAMASGSLQPLPSPWTEHIAPTGHLYYYNPHTTESTYNRPISLTFSNATPNQQSPPKKKRKKEKPAKKTPVPNSIWVRVLTNRGNVFFFDSEKGESTWDVPEGIEAAVEAMEAAELEEAREAMEAMDTGANIETGGEVHGSPLGTKRKVREEDVVEKRAGKRLKRDKVAEEGSGSNATIGMEDALDEDEDEEAWQRRLAEEMAGDMEDGDLVDEGGETKLDEEPVLEPVPVVPTMPLEEATQLFKTILREKQINPMHPWETSLPLITSDERFASLETSLQPPTQRDIFEEYCKEILKERKAAKGSSSGGAGGPGASASGQSAHDGYRKLLKETVTSTRTTYNEFRQKVKKERRFYSYGRDEKEREREFRNYLKELGDIKKNERKKAEDAFLVMLKESKATRTTGTSGTQKTWNEVKKEFQKDPRYDAVGSSTLREELYETFLKSLNDAGMEGVEEGPTTTKIVENVERPEDGELDGEADAKPSAKEGGEDEKRRRREKAVKEREERVRLEKERNARENARSRAGLNLEEAELAFNSLLVDAIRDPTISFASAMSYLSADPRFASISQASAMTHQRLNNLFQLHISHIQSKGSSVLHTLFESHAPGLDARWESLPTEAKNSIANNASVKRLGLDAKVSLRPPPRKPSKRSGLGHRGESRGKHSDTDEDEDNEEKFEYPTLRHEFERWQRQRFTEARAAFDVMLSENAFVEFWGRVGKMGLTDQEEKERLGKMVFSDEAGDVAVGDMEVDEDPGEGEGGGGKRDLQALAKGIDVKEVERVLRRDKRFILFEYMPEERQQWITDYLRGLSAPKASVHVG